VAKVAQPQRYLAITVHFHGHSIQPFALGHARRVGGGHLAVLDLI
jgi:hypothetical protein